MIKSTSALSYTNSKLTSNKTYYYKVRAFKKVNNKKIYGAYSEIKTYNPNAVKTNALNGEYTVSIASKDVDYNYSSDTIDVKGLRVDLAEVKKSIADTYRIGTEFTFKYKPSVNVIEIIKYKVTKIETYEGDRALILKCLSCVSKNTKTGKTTKSKKVEYNCLYCSKEDHSSFYVLCNYATSDFAYDYTRAISVSLYMNDAECLDDFFYNGYDRYEFYCDFIKYSYPNFYRVDVSNSVCTDFSPCVL